MAGSDGSVHIAGSVVRKVLELYIVNRANINACLTKELENETRASLAISASGLLRVADISYPDKEFGLRPKKWTALL